MPVILKTWIVRVPCAFAFTWCAATQTAAPAAPGDASPAATQAPSAASPAPLPPSSREMGAVDRRLAAKGFAEGSPVMIRIFKHESVLELWMRRGERFELFESYPICHWSGRLGPKLDEGDKQSPEGLYSVGLRQLHRRGQRPNSLNLGFPNAVDRAFSRTGSYILVHGGCTSEGCFAMTDLVMNEIFVLVEDALESGQKSVPVHIFPFRMSEQNLAEHADSEWMPFWINLKDAYDAFERTRVPPEVSACNRKYVVSESTIEEFEKSGLTGAGHRNARAPSAVAPCDRYQPIPAGAEPLKSEVRDSRARRLSTRDRYRIARIARKAAYAKRLHTKQASARSRRAK